VSGQTAIDATRAIQREIDGGGHAHAHRPDSCEMLVLDDAS
jgi:hypothetical protein